MPRLTRRNKRLLQNHDTLVQWFQHGLNTIVIVATLLLMAYWREGEVQSQYRAVAVFAVLLTLITYHVFGVHRRFESLLGGVQQIARAWGLVIIALAWVAFLTKTSHDYSRQVIVYWAILAFFGQALSLLITNRIYSWYSRNHRERLPCIIIGTGAMAHHLATSLSKNIWLRDKIIGVVGFEAEEQAQWKHHAVPFIGEQKDILSIIEKHRIRRVYVALPFENSHRIKEVQQVLIDESVDLLWAPDIFELMLLNHSVREVAGVPLIALNETPLMAGGPAFIKMMIDRSAALCMILLFSPVLIACAIAVRLSSEGPIIFKQRRDGWDGEKFFVYKFRSMYVHMPDKVIAQAKKGDPRITRVGAFLRKTSLDELPQLFNVLEGSMSLVGPRPHAESHNELYSNKVKDYLSRHRIKPGMTGLAQINGFRGETDTLEAMERRIEYDLEYISNWSPMLDLKILFLTPIALLAKNDNAY